MMLPSWVQPGVKFQLFFGDGNPNNRNYEVRGLVDDRVVLREWRRHKRRWQYIVEDEVTLRVWAEYVVIRK